MDMETGTVMIVLGDNTTVAAWQALAGATPNTRKTIHLHALAFKALKTGACEATPEKRDEAGNIVERAGWLRKGGECNFERESFGYLYQCVIQTMRKGVAGEKAEFFDDLASGMEAVQPDLVKG